MIASAQPRTGRADKPFMPPPAPPTTPRILTRSLTPTKGCAVTILDRAPWRLVFFVELGEAWWCVPGCRRLGQRIVVGKT